MNCPYDTVLTAGNNNVVCDGNEAVDTVRVAGKLCIIIIVM